MGKGRWLRLLPVVAAGFLLGSSMGTDGMTAWAMELTDDEMNAIAAELGESLSDGEASLSDEEEAARLIEELYKELGVLESGSPDIEALVSETIRDPELVMRKAAKREGLQYTLPNGEIFFSSVPNGMLTTGQVEFSAPYGAVTLVSVDNGPEEPQGDAVFTAPGSYRIRLLSYQLGQGEDHQVYEVSFYFTILEETVSGLGAVGAPEGFLVTAVRRDGKQQPVSHERCAFLSGDGEFEIQFRDQETETLFFETTFRRDTTAPFLTFSEEIGREALEGPVTFYPSEPNAQIVLRYNGNSGYALSDTLTTPGFYELTVMDSVGNGRSYQVQIRQVFELIDIRVIIMALVILACLVGRLLFLRRDMRVL